MTLPEVLAYAPGSAPEGMPIARVDERTVDVLILTALQDVLTALKQNEDALQQGALIMVDAMRNRVRILPLQRTCSAVKET